MKVGEKRQPIGLTPASFWYLLISAPIFLGLFAYFFLTLSSIGARRFLASAVLSELRIAACVTGTIISRERRATSMIASPKLWNENLDNTIRMLSIGSRKKVFQ